MHQVFYNLNTRYISFVAAMHWISSNLKTRCLYFSAELKTTLEQINIGTSVQTSFISMLVILIMLLRV